MKQRSVTAVDKVEGKRLAFFIAKHEKVVFKYSGF